MPSKSTAQRRFMAAAAHDPQFARKAGINGAVASEFHNADKRDAAIRKIVRKHERKLKKGY